MSFTCMHSGHIENAKALGRGTKLLLGGARTQRELPIFSSFGVRIQICFLFFFGHFHSYPECHLSLDAPLYPQAIRLLCCGVLCMER